MSERIPPAPSYPPRVSQRQAEAWTISGLTDKPRMPGEIAPRQDELPIRRIVERRITIREHREQLKAYCRAKANPADQDLSFARACRERGWSESTAARNVEKALGMMFMMLNLPPEWWN